MSDLQMRRVARMRRRARAKNIVRYILGFVVLISFFAVANLVWWDSEDSAGVIGVDSPVAQLDEETNSF